MIGSKKSKIKGSGKNSLVCEREKLNGCGLQNLALYDIS